MEDTRRPRFDSEQSYCPIFGITVIEQFKDFPPPVIGSNSYAVIMTGVRAPARSSRVGSMYLQLRCGYSLLTHSSHLTNTVRSLSDHRRGARLTS